MRPRHYRNKRDRHHRHRHCQYIDQSSVPLHKQGYSDDGSMKFVITMTPQSLSPPQTHDQAIQCIDDSVFQLQSPTAKPSPTAKSSPTTKPSLSAKFSNSSNVSRAATSIDTDSKHRVHLVTIHNDGTETHEYVNDDPEPLDEASQYES